MWLIQKKIQKLIWLLLSKFKEETIKAVDQGKTKKTDEKEKFSEKKKNGEVNRSLKNIIRSVTQYTKWLNICKWIF